MSRSATRRVVGAGAAVAGAGLATTAALRLAANRLRGRDGRGAGPVLDLEAARASRTISSHDGGTIHVVEAGAGPPIVLSHGVTLSSRAWEHQLADLPRAGFRALAFDHRGHGRSVVGETGHSVDNLGDDVCTVLETLDVADAVLVGHSMGGIAVQSFLVRHRDVAASRVRGVVLLSTLGRTPLAPRSARGRALVEALARHLPDSTAVWAARDLGLVLARAGFGRRPRGDDVEMVREMMLACPDATRREAPLALVGLDLLDRLRDVEVPTLVVVGSADLLTPVPYARALAAAVPRARLEVLAGGGHMLMLERADELTELLVGFARSLPTADARGAARR